MAKYCMFVVLFVLHELHVLVKSAKLIWKNDIHFGSDDLNFDLERISADTLASLNLQVDNSRLEALHNLAQPTNQNPLQDDYDYEYDYIRHLLLRYLYK